MKTVKQLLVLFLFISASIFANENAVKDVVTKFKNDVMKKNVSGVEAVVYPNAVFVSLNKITNSKDDIDRDTFVKYVKMGRVGVRAKNVSVKSVTVKGEYASALVNVENKKLIQEEFVTLLKVDGNWKIISSMYSIKKK